MRISDWSSDVCSSDLRWRQRDRHREPADRLVAINGERPCAQCLCGGRFGDDRGAFHRQRHDRRYPEATVVGQWRAYVRFGAAEQGGHLDRGRKGEAGGIERRPESAADDPVRSDERRVGKEWVSEGRARWW